MDLAFARDCGTEKTAVKVSLDAFTVATTDKHCLFNFAGGCQNCAVNSDCVNGFCQCVFGYYPLNGKCIRGISIVANMLWCSCNYNYVVVKQLSARELTIAHPLIMDDVNWTTPVSAIRDMLVPTAVGK